MSYHDKEIIKKIEAEARIKKPTVLSSKRSPFLNKGRSGGGSSGCGIVSTGNHPGSSGMTLGKIYYHPTIASLASPGDLIWDAWASGSGSGTQSFINEFNPQILWEVARTKNKVFQFFRTWSNDFYILELDFDDTIPSASFNRVIPLDNPQILPSGWGAAATAVDNNTIGLSSGFDVTTWDISGPIAYGTVVFSVPLTYGIVGDMVYDQTDDTWITLLYNGNTHQYQTVARWTPSGSLIHSHSLSSIPISTNRSAGCFCYNGEFHYAVRHMPGDPNYSSGSEIEIWKGTAAGTLVATFPQGSPFPPGGAITLPMDAATSPECCGGGGTTPTECYDIGDTGPEGGTIFAVPLGHPQNNGVNQTNFYYEVAKNDIAIGETPNAGFNASCGDTTTTTTSQSLQNMAVGGTSISGFGTYSINIGDEITSLTPGLFPPGTTVASIIPGLPAGSVYFTASNPANFTGNHTIILTTTSPPIPWSVSGAEWGVHNKPNIATSTDFGTGHKNTDAIDIYPLSPGNPTGGIHPWLDAHDIAATICKQHPSAKDDWFLPSRDEFVEMVDASNTYSFPLNLNTLGQNSEHQYWTSSQYRHDPTLGSPPQFPDKYSWTVKSNGAPGLAYRCHALSVRPIRRFECELEPSCSGCDCVEYNWRDGYCGGVVGALCSGSIDRKDSNGMWIPITDPITHWVTTNGGTTPGSFVYNIDDSVVGGPLLVIHLNKTDVLGNTYSLSDFSSGNGKFKVSMWDTSYNFMGEWGYDFDSVDDGGFTTDGGKGPGIIPVPNKYAKLWLKNGVHLKGNYPHIYYNSGLTANTSATGIYIKIEWDGANNYETGCNSSIFGNPHPYNSPGSQNDWPSYCGPIFTGFAGGSYTGIDSAIPRYATFQPTDLQGNLLTVYPDIYSAIPTYTATNPGWYPTPATMSHICDCDYQVGDTGPAGGIIVATPWMNAGTVTPNGFATNNSNYYFELAPSSLGSLQWGNYTVSGYTPGYNNNPDETQGQDNTDTMLSGYSPILTTLPGGQNAFDACNDYTLNNRNDWFLPSVEELWFVRNNLPGTINSLLWSSNFFDDFYPNPSVYIENYDSFSNPPSSWDRSKHTALAVDMNTTITKDLSTGTYTIGDTIATESLRYQTIDVRPMRKFECSSSPIAPSSKRQSFINKKIKRPEETGPFGMLGYYPLYDTAKGATNSSPESNYHIHEFGGQEYYMPEGLEMGKTQFHGDWNPKMKKTNLTVLPSVESFISQNS